MKTILFAAAGALALSASAFAQGDNGLSTLPSGTYVMDKTHGYVTFSYSHLGLSNPILRFNDVDATVDLNADDLTASTLSVEIDAASVDTGVERFDKHIKSGDFFDVENNPSITFTSTSIDLSDPAAGTLTGDLTMMGITKPVTLDVKLNKAGDHPITGNKAFGITATSTVDRTEWGLGGYAPAVSAEVDIRIEAEFGLSE